MLNQFIETPHYGHAWQLQRVSDLAGANGGAQRSQGDVDADGSVGQAVTVGSKLRTVVVGNGTGSHSLYGRRPADATWPSRLHVQVALILLQSQ